MTTIFSTVDRLTSRIKLMDTLVNTIASRFLPQNEAAALSCDSGTYLCGYSCSDDYCHPTGDLYPAAICGCCYNSNNQFSHAYLCDCNNC
jgi:hypothetical protein